MIKKVPKVLKMPARITIKIAKMSPDEVMIPGTVRKPTPIIELTRRNKPFVKFAFD